MHALQEENGRLKASNDDLTVRLQEAGSRADRETNGPDLKVVLEVLTPFLERDCCHHILQHLLCYVKETMQDADKSGTIRLCCAMRCTINRS